MCCPAAAARCLRNMLTTVYGCVVLQVLEETGIAVAGACVCCSRLLGGVFESVLDGSECAVNAHVGRQQAVSHSAHVLSCCCRCVLSAENRLWMRRSAGT